MEIAVDHNRLNLLLSDFERYASTMQSLSEEIASQTQSIPLLKTAQRSMQTNCNGLQQLKKALESAVLEYSATENRMCAFHASNYTQTSADSLVSYVEENDVDKVFSTFNFVTYYIDDIGILTGFGYFFSHFDDNIKALIKSRKNQNGSFSERIADEFMNDKENVKGILSGVIESMLENKVETKYKGSKIKVMKTLDELTDLSVSEELRQILNESYSVDKGLTKISEAAEKIEYLLTDYSDNIELLNSLRNIAPNNKALNEVIDDILFDYRHKFTDLLLDEVVDKIEKFSQKSLDYICGTSFGLVNSVIKGTIGQAPSINALDTVIHIENIKNSAIQTYKAAVSTIKSGTYSDADFNAYVNSFNLCKELTLKEYRAMLEHYNNPYSEEHIYLNSQIKLLENMTYDNVSQATAFSKFEAVSYGSGQGGLFSSGSGLAGGRSRGSGF